MGYFKDALKGVTWMGAFRISYRIIGLARIAIIAHLLTPYNLGVFAVATISLGFLEIITETGINVFLVQEKDNLEDYINTAWVVSIIRGLAITLLILVSAGPVSHFFHSPDARNLLYLVALVPLIKGFINPSVVKFQKDLRFEKQYFYKTSVFFIESLLSIVGAYVTKSPLGLIFGLIGGAIYEVIYTFIIVAPRPIFTYEVEKLRKIINRGKWITLYGIFDYIYTTSDNVIVGRMLGVAPLGIYSNAYKISTAPLTEIGGVFFGVTFVVFSKISDDVKRLKRAFIKNFLVTSILMISSGIFIFIFATPIVEILLGKGWEMTIPVIRLLTILGVVRGIATSSSSLLVAMVKQKYATIVVIVSTLGLLATIVPLVKTYGIIGAGLAAITGTVVSLPFTIYYVGKALKEKGE